MLTVHLVNSLLLAGGITVAATPLPGSAVSLEYGTFVGTGDFAGVTSFLGMPFANAGRFEKPRLISAAEGYLGLRNATEYGPQCPQGPAFTVDPEGIGQIGGILGTSAAFITRGPAPESEDCLSINVQIPSGFDVHSRKKLPVLFWIHGGGFSTGAGAVTAPGVALESVIYQGGYLVNRSVELKQPTIFVSANHRLGLWGFLAGKEMTEAGVSNLGLQDQRTALKWVQRYIRSFGGDPAKVTLIGESAGALSIATHMVMNGGNNEGLFRGAMMFSGGIMKLADAETAGQPTFDQAASFIGCNSAADKLACMRNASADDIQNAAQQFPGLISYQATNIPWYPRPDGVTLEASPHQLIRQGKVAHIPYVIADVEDEGTLFALVPQLNITTDADFRAYFAGAFRSNISEFQLNAFLDLYPDDPAIGSPFGTGGTTFLGPQYKRLSATIGDLTFQSGRRDLLSYTYQTQRAYTALIQQDTSRYSNMPIFGDLSQLQALGSFHASDSGLNIFGTLPSQYSNNTQNIMSTIIAFTNSLDPNQHGLQSLPKWPIWNPSAKSMFRFSESGPTVIKDDFREAPMAALNSDPDLFVN